MNAIALADYWKGRDVEYADACTDAIRANAARTVDVVNAVLAAMAADGVDLAGVHVASGWRPPAVNDATSNAGQHSRHLTAEACDLADLPDRRLARWALAHPDTLKACGVEGMERPQWTPTWLHVQTVAAGSGRFCYVPSRAPSLTGPLPGELDITLA